jgi:hypothetical protein
MSNNLTKKIEKLEVDHNFDIIQIDRVRIWDIYRYRLQNFSTITPNPKQSKNYISLLKSIWITIWRLKSQLSSVDSFVFLRHPRLTSIGNDTLKDIYSDDLIKDTKKDKNCIIFDPLYIHNEAVEYKNNTNIPTSSIYILVGLLYKILAPFNYYRFSKSKSLYIFYTHIQEFLPIGWSYEDFKHDIFNIVYKFKLHRFVWTLIFRYLRPKFLILTLSYGNEAVIDAARKCGVTVVELQHGSPVIGKLNYDYKSGVTKTYVPDIFFSFGGFMHEQLPKLPHKKVIPLGFAHFTKFIKQQDYEKKDRQNKNILILSQPKVDDKLQKWLLENMKFLVNYNIEIRLHPSYDQMDTLPFSQIDCTITKSKDYPLYSYINTFDIVLGCFSTALYEARALGLDAYIIPGEHESLIKHFIQEGHGVLLPEKIDSEFIKNNPNFGDYNHIFKDYTFDEFLFSLEVKA